MKKEYTLKEVARLCGETYLAIWNAVQRQELKTKRTPKGQHRVLKTDLVKFMKGKGLKL